ncbi:MAG: aconitate hydratase 2/2-methylisocitrate dehydratase [bacterium]|jgi:aconitate hydratase 2/2-methylisocitrate dehydratase
MIESYLKHVQERAEQSIPALALSDEQTKQVCEMLITPPKEKGEFLLDLLVNRINPGVDPAAQVKAHFLTNIANGTQSSPLISKEYAIEILGTMLGGYNLQPLVELLESPELGAVAAKALSNIILVGELFDTVFELSKTNEHAKAAIDSWSKAEWFTSKSALPNTIECVVYKVDGEINTDDFSPASHAWSRADIPLHANCMGESLFPDGIQKIKELKESTGLPIAFVGDVVGTGSSRKSAANSLLWHIGEDIPFIPNKRRGGVILGGQIAPIFFSTAEDSGALPIRCDVSKLSTGMKIVINTAEGKITGDNGDLLSDAPILPVTVGDEYQAGGRVPLIIGRTLTAQAQEASNALDESIFKKPDNPAASDQGYTLAQKMVGVACGVDGILPGTYCEPKMTTVGSQDTTGPMTRDELSELACLGFQSEMVMQSFCHTAAYPKSADIQTHRTLPNFISDRKGVSLRPGDGIIHSWLNRLLLPDTVGTGGDSHTRFPIGISFPAGSGLVAFAAALGKMPLDMPESVLVRFKGELQTGITLRDAVNAIPYVAMKQGLLNVSKQNKINIFNGKILEIEGLPDLKVEQAFELTDSAAERSAAACAIQLGEKTVSEYLRSNVSLMKKMIEDGYQDAETLQNRIDAVSEWLAKPELMKADTNAEYAAIIEVDLSDITEPILACPNDPDKVKTLSEILADKGGEEKVDEVFIGSCMTNIGHYRAAAEVLGDDGYAKSVLWVCPPTRMDELQLREEGVYSVFSKAGARTEMPGCSLCMGNQARVHDNAVVFSTSTRNFNNRMGTGAQVYLGSAELAAVIAKLGRLPQAQEYLEMVNSKLAGKDAEIYRYLDFSKMDGYSA